MSPLSSPDLLAALFALAFASTWSPGPNNIMLANSGATFGWRATCPHAFGVALGFPLMLLSVALILGEAFQHSALLREGLRWAGVALLLWLSWRVATAGRAQAEGRGRPFTFAQAAAFQWINPKAWVMAVSTAATFITGAAPLRDALVCALVFAIAGLGSAHAWAAGGAAMRRVLSTDGRLRLFNAAMGGLIALSAIYMAGTDL